MTDSPQQTLREHSAASPGTMLREAREAANLTHAAVGEALHLTGHYIRSLESDEYNKLPGLIFVKGYIKSYARFMKLDVDLLLDLYEQRVQAMPLVVKNQTLAGNYTRKRNDQAIGWAIAATLVILLGLGIGWWFVGRDDQPENTTQLQLHKTLPVQNTAAAGNDTVEQNSAGSQLNSNEEADAAATSDARTAAAADIGNAADNVAPAATAAGSPPAAAPANAADKISVTPAPAGGRQINLRGPGPDQLQMSFGANSWVEVNDASGKRLYAEMLHAGDTLQLQGQTPLQVLLGDARHVKVNLNSAPLDISSSIRSDFTARLTMSSAGIATPTLVENSAAGSRTAGMNH